MEKIHVETYCDAETPEERLKRKERQRMEALERYGMEAIKARKARLERMKDGIVMHMTRED